MPSKRRPPAEDDPLTLAIAPPPNETIQERDARVHREREAKKVSDEIDEEIKKGQKKAPKAVKILLLGEYHRHRAGRLTLTDVFMFRPE